MDEKRLCGWLDHRSRSAAEATALPERRSWWLGKDDVPPALPPPLNHRLARCPAGAGTARCAGDSPCAEEDSNLHPVIPDQALNLVTRVSDPSYASIACRTSGILDRMDAMDDLDVAANVATGALVVAASEERGTGYPAADTRIMVPLLFGSTAPFAGAGGHRGGHICKCLARNDLSPPRAHGSRRRRSSLVSRSDSAWARSTPAPPVDGTRSAGAGLRPSARWPSANWCARCAASRRRNVSARCRWMSLESPTVVLGMRSSV
jgi:hypothetical protein